MNLINKQEAIRLLKLNYDDSPRDTGDLMYNDGVRSCVKTVREMKAVSGEWISKDKVFGGIPFACSNCGEETKETVMGKPRFRFCPMCGLPMCGAFCGGDEQ